MAAPSSTVQPPTAPTPEQMHHWILKRVKDKKYFSITTPSLKDPEQTPWQALKSNRNMETRACFHTGSRIHTLTCGHSVAVLFNAESCAMNCAHQDTSLIDGNPVPSKYAASLATMRNSYETAIRAYSAALDAHGVPGRRATIENHIAANSIAVKRQNTTLRPAVDFVGGEFPCRICDRKGDRKCNQAYYVTDSPYFCVVVAWGAKDVDVLKKLVGGVKPAEPSLPRPSQSSLPVAHPPTPAQAAPAAQVLQPVAPINGQTGQSTPGDEGDSKINFEDIDLIDL